MLSVTEANDINTVLRHLLGLPGALGETVRREDAEIAATRLADQAYKRLRAGLSGREVAAAFVQRAEAEAQMRADLGELGGAYWTGFVDGKAAR